MGSRALHECLAIGCHTLTKDSYCELHTKDKPQPDYRKEAETRRPSAHKRGYNGRWQRYAKVYLVNHPLCVTCLEAGRAVAANVVDHIKDHKGDARLFWDTENHQALCQTHHHQKTARENN